MANRGLIAAAAISMLVLAYPTSHAAEEKECPDGRKAEQCKACAAAPADQQCAKHAKDCYYKFTVQKVVDAETLEVTFPPSVFSRTDPKLRDQKEQDYENKVKGKPLTIHVKSGTAKKDTTYLFTRCPDNKFDLKKEIKPDEDK